MLEIRKNSHRRGSTRRSDAKSSLRTIRKVVVIGGVVALLGGGAIFGYGAVTGSGFGLAMNTTYGTRASSAEIADIARAGIQPKVVIEAFKKSIVPGSETALVARTEPGVDCTIKVEYGEKKTLAVSSGLVSKKADQEGKIMWRWKVQPDMPPGRWPTTVMCGKPENQGKAVGSLIVSKPAYRVPN